MIRNEKSVGYLAIGVGFLLLAALLFMTYRTGDPTPLGPYLLIFCGYSAFAGLACLGASIQKALKRESTGTE